MRARCSVYIAISLDGFIARPNGAIDWLAHVQREGEDYGYQRFHDSIDTLVVGRNTYETALGFEAWPYHGKRCIVLTHAKPTSRNGEEFYAGAPNDLVERLTAEGAKHVYVDGGVVIQQFIAGGLVSDVTLSIVPVLLGEGIRLFGGIPHDIRLKLLESRSFESGLVQLVYSVA